ncbi:MAG: 50S ribosomal protein L10 [Planctomycetota bacterium]|nr:50S ribosomal protein L10 [Planctomycetota bacterium]MCX8040204.1 50S ribosomal protein L10 [Planctomycetota bacterium]MDW8372501.1 50S ribosomal protein L10 [Planctomycetota bacterium]
MPSLINELMLAEVSAAVQRASAVVVVDASRLNAADAIAFRAKLRGVGARLLCAKASIIYRALPADFARVAPCRGPAGLVCCGDDIAATAKLINELAKEEKIALKGAVMEGRALDAARAKALADLPTREQARAQLVRALQAPLAQLVRIVHAKPSELVRVLKVASERN